MSLAWKKFQRSEASMFLWVASFCAPLPSVSANARNSARIAITSATFRLKPSPPSMSPPSFAFSMASLISDMMAPFFYPRGRIVPVIARSASDEAATLGARMRRAIGLDQALGVHFGVDLRGRQRGVAEQLLDRAQVAAARQQMRGEGVPQRMRRRRLGQPQGPAQPGHGELDEARRQRS